jgi:hypothetical protein
MKIRETAMDYYDHLKNYDVRYKSDAEFKQNVDSVDTNELKRKWLQWYPFAPVTSEQVDGFISDHPEYDLDYIEYILYRWIEASARS